MEAIGKKYLPLITNLYDEYLGSMKNEVIFSSGSETQEASTMHSYNAYKLRVLCEKLDRVRIFLETGTIPDHESTLEYLFSVLDGIDNVIQNEVLACNYDICSELSALSDAIRDRFLESEKS